MKKSILLSCSFWLLALVSPLFGGLAFVDVTSPAVGVAVSGYVPDPGVSSVVVPPVFEGKPVVAVLPSVFKDQTSLESVDLPASVELIGAEAFSGCTALSMVSFSGSPEGLKSLGDGAFRGCSSLMDFPFPSTVESVGASCFKDCTSLFGVLFPESLTSVGVSAFEGCFSLLEVYFPQSIVVIPDSCFLGCAGLSILDLPGPVESVGFSAFMGCSSLRSFPFTESLRVIGGSAFRFSGLSSVILPDSVNSLGSSAFADCYQLASFRFGSGVVVVPDSCFSGCFTLSSVVFPPALSGVSVAAFADCSSLVTLSLPASVTSLGDFAFSNCSSLSWVRIVGPAPFLGDQVFQGTHSSFFVYYYPWRPGFTDPGWVGVTLVPLSTVSFSSWLVMNGLPAGSPPLSDPDGDGVSLLVAYAFGLDPAGSNLAASVPKAVLNRPAGTLVLTYPEGAQDVQYVPEWSRDLSVWSSSGVSNQGLVGGFRVVSVPVDSAPKFFRLRLVIQP